MQNHSRPARLRRAQGTARLMSQNKELLKKIIDFFATRFVLREASLWRVLRLIKPMRHMVITANVLLTIASILGSFVLVSLMPLFQFTLNPDNAKGSLLTGEAKQDPLAAKSAYAARLLRAAQADLRTTHTLAVVIPAADDRPTQTLAIVVSHNDLLSTQPLPAYLSQADAPSSRSLAALIKRDAAVMSQTQAANLALVKESEKEVKKSNVQKALEKIPFYKHFEHKIEHESKRWGERYDAAIAWGHQHPQKFVGYVCLFLFLMLMLQGLLQFIGDSMLGKVGIDTTGNLLRDIYGNVLQQEMKFFDQTSTGTLINTCYREVFELRNIITFLASTRLMLPIQMATLFASLLVISGRFTFLLCCLMPLVILPTMVLTRSLKKAIRDMMQGEAKPIDLMTEAFHGIRAIKAFSAEKYESRQMDPAVTDYEGLANRRRSAQAMIDPMVDVLNTLVIMLVFAAICIFLPDTLREAKVQAKLLAFMAAVQRFYKPFRSLMTMNISMQRSAMAAKRIFALLDRKPEIIDAPDAVDFPADWSEVRFDNVHLAYEVFFKGQPRHRPALRGVNLRIARGESIAFVGPNGAGKSSMVNLLCRLYDPTHGAINFDDVPLTKIRMKSLREKVCLITQHPILFNRSVSENIAFGLEDISQARIEEAARSVNAHNFIMNLPDGYDSLVGETGKLLSGGERQKIVLARAFVRNPDLLIFDEPTTGLDKETTQEFLELIDQLRQRRMTIIYITHEHTHLRRFERILQLTPEKKVLEVTPEVAAAMLRDTAKVGA